METLCVQVEVKNKRWLAEVIHPFFVALHLRVPDGALIARDDQVKSGAFVEAPFTSVPRVLAAAAG